MRLAMLVQQVDEQNWLRGFTVQWIRALAAHVDRLEVITLERGDAELPPHVHVQTMGKERGYSRPRELVAFYRALGRVIGEVDAIFSHMTPRYTWLAAPLAIAYRKPQMLWFTHRQISLELRLALAASRWITTASPDSFPIASPKVHVMGHGIDTALFSPGDTSPDDPPLVLAVGRITPIKYHHALIEVAARLREMTSIPVRFAVIGAVAAPGDEDYERELLLLRDTKGLDEASFSFLGAMPAQELVTWYRRAAVVTNLTPAGSFDKSVLEAMLTARPVLVAHHGFDSLLGSAADLLRIAAPDQAEGAAQKLADLLALPPQIRQQMGAELRQRTAEAHGLDAMMQRLVGLFSAL